MKVPRLLISSHYICDEMWDIVSPSESLPTPNPNLSLPAADDWLGGWESDGGVHTWQPALAPRPLFWDSQGVNLLWTVINVHNIDIALSPSSHFYSQSLQARHVCTAINFTDLEVSPMDEFSARWNECRVANSLSLHGGVLMPRDWRRRKLGLHSVWVYSRMHRVVVKYLLLWPNKDENHFQLFVSFKLMNELSLSGEDVFAI